MKPKQLLSSLNILISLITFNNLIAMDEREHQRIHREQLERQQILEEDERLLQDMLLEQRIQEEMQQRRQQPKPQIDLEKERQLEERINREMMKQRQQQEVINQRQNQPRVREVRPAPAQVNPSARMRGGRAAPVPLKGQRGASYPQAQRKFEFANQSDQYATVWTQNAPNCWQPLKLFPYQDSGILNPIDQGIIYIYTNTRHYVLETRDGMFRLIREIASEFDGRAYQVLIKQMPFAEVQDIVVIINPDGKVDFVPRRPLH